MGQPAFFYSVVHYFPGQTSIKKCSEFFLATFYGPTRETRRKTISVCPGLFNWPKCLPGTFKWNCGSKTAFLPLVGHVVIQITILWTSIFLKILNIAAINHFDWQNFLTGTVIYCYGLNMLSLANKAISHLIHVHSPVQMFVY